MKYRKLFLFILIFTAAGCGIQNREEMKTVLDSTEKIVEGNLSEPGFLYEGQGIDDAMAELESMMKSYGLTNSTLYYNLGNACYLNGETGKAVFYYRKAQREAPFNTVINSNLAKARSKVSADESDKKFFYVADFPVVHYLYGKVIVHLSVLAVGLAFWGLFLYFRMIRGNRVLAVKIIGVLYAVVVFFHIVLCGFVLWDNQGIVLVNKTLLRQGDNPYAASGSPIPLNEGLEFRVVKERNGWLFIRLADGRGGWIEKNSTGLFKDRFPVFQTPSPESGG